MVFGDGLQTRDYVHVHDIVSANLLAAESDAGGSFNIGRGEQITVIDIVEALAPTPPTASPPTSSRSAPARCGTSPSTPRARVRCWAGSPRSGSSKGLEQTLGSLR